MHNSKITTAKISKAAEVLKKLKKQKEAFRDAVISGDYKKYAKQQSAGTGTPVPNSQ